MNNGTPCSEWNVQTVINHSIKVTGFAHGILTENITVDPQQASGPLPAEGAVAALDAGVAKVLELIKAPGSAAKQINTPFGAMTRGEVIMMPFLDILIHSWDLAKGTGQNTTLDSGLVEVCYNALGSQMDGFRGMRGSDSRHFLGPAVPVSDNASVQDKLIGLSGRQP